MQGNYTSARTFSDMATSYAKLAESASRLELKLNIQPLSVETQARPQVHKMEFNWLPFTFALLWGSGLFGALEVDSWPLKAAIIAFIAIGSFGMDLMFFKR